MDCWMKFLWTTDFGISLKLYQHIFYKENEISISYDPNYQKELRWNPSLKDFSNASIKIFLL